MLVNLNTDQKLWVKMGENGEMDDKNAEYGKTDSGSEES